MDERVACISLLVAGLVCWAPLARSRCIKSFQSPGDLTSKTAPGWTVAIGIRVVSRAQWPLVARGRPPPRECAVQWEARNHGRCIATKQQAWTTSVCMRGEPHPWTSTLGFDRITTIGPAGAPIHVTALRQMESQMACTVVYA